MKFIELHIQPSQAGKHNMHADGEELSDSVSCDHEKRGQVGGGEQPVD